MQLRKKYILTLLASGMTLSSMHAEESQAAMTINESAQTEAALSPEIKSADAESPTSSEGKANATLMSAIENMPGWSKDLASRIKIHGYAQGGYTYMSKGAQEHYNSFDIKRVLFWANAQITDRWSFLFMHDFSSVVQEFYTDYRLTNNKALTVRLGQFKNALSYENKLSPTGQEVIDVYADGVTYLTGCGSDPLFGVQYGRDLGLALFGETNNGRLRYEVNILNGTGVNKKDGNREKDFIGRLDWKPVKGLTLVA
ncbi:MAG: porin, partial [Bacteroidales bacterium]|nr:porin [Bacteroidales bacterium]